MHTRSSAARRLHLVLLLGLVMICASFGSLFFLDVAPLLEAQDRQLIALALAGFSAPPLLLGWLWARSQLPLKAPHQTSDQYWDDPAVIGKAVLLWVLFEGGSIIGAVGYLMTGSVVPGAATAIGLASLLLNGPSQVESRS